MLEKLKASSKKASEGFPDEFDLLVVGGGATGAGVAVDAASRGLKVALVERDDFSSGKCSSPDVEGILLALALRLLCAHCTWRAPDRIGAKSRVPEHASTRKESKPHMCRILV